MRALVILPLVATGCGFGLWEEEPGGGANLPTAAAGPYGRLERDSETPAEEPFLLANRDGVYRDPAALRRDDGGVRIWYGSDLEDDPGGERIAYVELPSLHDLPDVAPSEVLAPIEAWEGDRLAAPSIVDGGDGRLVMFYEAGDPSAPSIGIARSDDDGATWQREGDPILVGAAGPAAVAADGAYVLFVTRPGLGGEPGVFRTDPFALDGVVTLRDTPVVAPRPGVAEAFDAALVADPFVLVETTPTGRTHWSLWFAGASEATDAGSPLTAVGYAGSFDGDTWQRPAGPDPVLASPAGGPAVLVDGTTGVMLFHEDQRLRLGIAAASHP